jgi:hypothetical protein
MHLMLAAAVTELLELDTTRGRLLVLRRRVVPLFALGALQCNDFAHFLKPFSSCQFSAVSYQFFSARSSVSACFRTI